MARTRGPTGAGSIPPASPGNPRPIPRGRGRGGHIRTDPARR